MPCSQSISTACWLCFKIYPESYQFTTFPLLLFYSSHHNLFPGLLNKPSGGPFCLSFWRIQFVHHSWPPYKSCFSPAQNRLMTHLLSLLIVLPVTLMAFPRSPHTGYALSFPVSLLPKTPSTLRFRELAVPSDFQGSRLFHSTAWQLRGLSRFSHLTHHTFISFPFYFISLYFNVCIPP